jgi:hypothetical protein
LSPEIAPAARDAVIEAYYPTALQAAEAARNRAQSAYTIASAVAAAIVAGGIFGDIGDQPVGVQVLGVVTLAAWLLAAILFIQAITGSVEAPESGEQEDVDAFVRAAVNNVSSERKTVSDRQGRAYGITLVAIVLTLSLIVTLLVVEPESQSIAATVSVTPAGTDAVKSACPDARSMVHGELDPDTLGSAFVTVMADAGVCGDQSVAVRLPRSSILAVVADPKTE